VRGDVETWSTYVKALGKAGKLDAIEDAMREMTNQGVVPNVVTFNTILGGY